MLRVIKDPWRILILTVALQVQISQLAVVKLEAFKVVITITDLNPPNVLKMILPGPMSVTRCGSVTLHKPDVNRLFCKTPTGDCLISNASYIGNYDDGSGGGGYRCYSILKPLFPRGYKPAPGECPLPFRLITATSCIYIDTSWFTLATFANARKTCQSIIDGVDLYTGQATAELTNYVASLPFVLDPWVGIRKDSSGTFKRIDGTAVNSWEWGWFQPEGVGLYTFVPGSTADCVILWTIDFMSYPRKFADTYCDEFHSYVCQLPV